MTPMTYKTQEWTTHAPRVEAARRPGALTAYAHTDIPHAVLRDYFWQALCVHHGDLDAMGRGVFLYWDADQHLLDVAVATGHETTAPLSEVLERAAVAHRVAPYRFGGDLSRASWPEVRHLIDVFPVAAQDWIRDFNAPPGPEPRTSSPHLKEEKEQP